MENFVHESPTNSSADQSSRNSLFFEAIENMTAPSTLLPGIDYSDILILSFFEESKWLTLILFLTKSFHSSYIL